MSDVVDLFPDAEFDSGPHAEVNSEPPEELPLMLRVAEHEGRKMVQMKFGDVLIHMDAQSAHELAIRLEQAAWQAR